MNGQSGDNKIVKWRCPKCGSVNDIGQVRCVKCDADLLLMGKLVYVNDSGGIIGEVTSKEAAGIDIPFVDIESDSDPDYEVPPVMSRKTKNTEDSKEDDPIEPDKQEASGKKKPSQEEAPAQPDMKKKKTKNPAYRNDRETTDKNKPKKRRKFWIAAGCVLACIIASAGIFVWKPVLPKISLENSTGTQNSEATPTPAQSTEATPAPARSTEATPEPTQNINGNNNLLKADAIDPAAEGGKVFGSEINREEINRVEILNTLDKAPKDAWDVSVAGDGCVLAWVEKKDDVYTLFIAGEGGVNANQACRALFMNYKNLQEIAFNGSFFTKGCTDMACMFANCSSLGILYLDDFDTSCTQNFNSMFYGCTYLYNLAVGNFDTENVEDMSYMFYGCSNLTNVDVSGFNTENVEDMSYMFYGCCNLASVNVSRFITKNVTTMKAMFHDCANLKKIDVGRFKTSKVTTMECMFNGCSGLKDVDVSDFDTVNVTNLSHMFYNCTNLEKVDVCRWDTFNAADMSYMFYGCANLSMENDYISIPGDANKEGIFEGTKYTLNEQIESN